MMFLFCCALSFVVGAMVGAMLLVILADRVSGDL